MIRALGVIVAAGSGMMQAGGLKVLVAKDPQSELEQR
jgi:hypothetical protein